MKKQIQIFGLLFLLLTFSCANNENASFEMADEKSMSAEPEKQEVDVERKLIKEGNVRFETNDIDATRKQIFKSIEKYQGYTSSDREYKSNGSVNNKIIIRVPAANFDNLLNEATAGIAKFESKNIEIKDVTEEFLDVEARLKTKKELENRYLELLQKTNSVIEILEVEKQIGQLRAEIESVEGRLNYLKSKVSFSTLTLDFYQSIPNQTAFGNKFINGFKNGWDNLIWFFVALTNVWPFLILLLVVLFWIARRRGKKKQ